ncbi:hypothetical protein O181_106245 [Austropuccinia psidii MF-1]|uniref:Uncharacterized protein n=1 Tax=Austropuccinia psidii MF-1 TaxID=1389203 RepID=A0A9Q3JS34_9BASI|nr:hypothetical protein [Austropuccinia psidii MF-1]
MGERGPPPSPQGQVGPKPQLDPPEQYLATNSLDPKLAKNPMDKILAINSVGTIFGHGPPWTILPVMASGSHQRPPDHLSKPFPQLKGNSFHFYMHPVLKVAGVVHIWYYIPLCTIFAHIQLISLTSYGGNQKTLQGSEPPVSAGVGLVHYSGLFKRAILKRYYINSISCQGLKPNWAISYSTVQTRSQAIAQAVLTPTTRAPLDSTPAVPQLVAQLDRGPSFEIAAPSRKEGRGQEDAFPFEE